MAYVNLFVPVGIAVFSMVTLFGTLGVLSGIKVKENIIMCARIGGITLLMSAVFMCVCLLFLWGLRSAHAGDSPPACAPNEPPRYCSLKLERNEALDRLANCDGDDVIKGRAADALAAWWKSYAEGISQQTEWWDHVWKSLPPKPNLAALKGGGK